MKYSILKKNSNYSKLLKLIYAVNLFILLKYDKDN